MSALGGPEIRVRPRRLGTADIVRVGAHGLRSRPLRVALSALGIAIGIAAMVAVVGISTSSRADLDQTLQKLGTNLLTAGPGKTIFGDAARLPAESVAMVRRIGPVRSASATGRLDVHVYRNEFIPDNETGSITVAAALPDLLSTVGATVNAGSWLNRATAAHPAIVLGDAAARRLGIRQPGTRVWVSGTWFSVAGILDPVPLAPELDGSVLMGWEAARTYEKFDGQPTMIYTRTTPDSVEAVRDVLAATANPAHPDQVAVSRPSDALAAQRAVAVTGRGLLLGLGAVALLVGGIGVANTMVISVLERRSEIGLRRSLGATKGQIRTQFLTESLLMSALGGGTGALLGIAVTTGYASTQDWPVVVPAWASLGGVGATIVIGVFAGIYPAVRAARLAPAVALATS